MGAASKAGLACNCFTRRFIRLNDKMLFISFLEYLLPPNSTSALHIYFPDPWPKRKHRRHRLINERFPEIAARSLLPDGMVYLRTDDQDYFQQMLEVFGASALFQEAQTPNDLAEIRTDFEKDFQARGIQTLRKAYMRV